MSGSATPLTVAHQTPLSMGFQARMLEWAAMPSSRAFPDPRIKPESLAFPPLTGGFSTAESSGNPSEISQSQKDKYCMVSVM